MSEGLKTEIINKVIAALDEKTLTRTDLASIARATQVDFKDLVSLFKGDAGINFELAKQANRLLARFMSSADHQLPPAERLIDMGMMYLDFAETHPGLFNYMYTYDDKDKWEDISFAEIAHSNFALLQDTIKEGIEQGVFVKQYEPVMSLSAWSMIQGFAHIQSNKLSPFGGSLSREAKRQVMDSLYSGLLTDSYKDVYKR
ncbi:TetR-like C-terminal domain-containing protein [Motilimonas pumila]|uniref:WHG domain-containing protein n=1 Tax=Motilimonas pumila TaxID=2303987 RepID=A0A418YBN1_9GAMM|nr:TetR-like C-terminal domain-containing protein [Motilimonas pumila]RJG41915.1 WHG domain-containing protein [Motilimonas pumila]